MYGLKGNRFTVIARENNEATTPGEMINQAASYFKSKDYKTAAVLYRRLYNLVLTEGTIPEGLHDLAVETLFYLAKSLELDGEKNSAMENYNRLVKYFPGHWMAKAAQGELKMLQ